ncbi:MAG: replicative DNA helicase [Planctomycetota bacterium]
MIRDTPESAKAAPSAPEIFTKVPPQAPDAEKSVLGAILLKGDVLLEVAPLISASDFYDLTNQRIYEALLGLFQSGSRVDPVLIREELARRGELEKVGGVEYLTHLAEMVPSAAGAEHYARLVRKKSLARSLINLCTEIQGLAYEGGLHGEELLDLAENRIFSLSKIAADLGLARMRDILNEALSDIAATQASKGALTGLATGFLRLDELTAGLHGGELIIVAGRPAMGKTTFANCIAKNVALHQNKTVAIFSMEVNAKQVVTNLLCSEAKVDALALRRGLLEAEQEAQLANAASRLEQTPIYIDDFSNTNVLQLRAKARRIKQKYGLGLLIVDYVQLLETVSMDNRQQEMAQISRGLKATARELDVPLIAVSQLNRAVDQREDRRPRMSDLRESGALEQDADLILFIYRDEYYHPEKEQSRNLAEVIIAKQRNGPTGKVDLRFSGQYLRFDNYQHGETPF